MREPTFEILNDLIGRCQAEPGLHVGDILREYGIDYADAAAWTRIGARTSHEPRQRPRDIGVAAQWYLSLREYTAWHFLIDLDAFEPDKALDIVFAYERGNLASPNPTNAVRMALQEG